MDYSLPDNEKFKILTEREKQVTARIIKGMTAKQISTELNISEETVNKHKQKILDKTGMGSSHELAFWASDNNHEGDDIVPLTSSRPLSVRQKKAFRHARTGMSGPQIAEEMKTTEVAAHDLLKEVYQKTGVHSRIELMQLPVGTEPGELANGEKTTTWAEAVNSLKHLPNYDILQKSTLTLADDRKFDILTEREKQVTVCVVLGLQDKEIGDLLGISHWTVKTHLQNIYNKTSMGSRDELAAWAKSKKTAIENIVPPEIIKGLTVRQLEAIRLAGEGMSNRGISEVMHTGENNVKSFLRRAYATTGLNRRQLRGLPIDASPNEPILADNRESWSGSVSQNSPNHDTTEVGGR